MSATQDVADVSNAQKILCIKAPCYQKETYRQATTLLICPRFTRNES